MTRCMPGTTATVTIPDLCRMRGAFISSQNIQIMVGKQSNGVKLRFDYVGLERFTRLALELLSVPHEEEPPSRPVRITQVGLCHPPDITAGDDSPFIRNLRKIGKLAGPYADWLLQTSGTSHPKPLTFDDQFGFSAAICNVGHGIRELAYSHLSEEEVAQLVSEADNEVQP